MEMSFQRWGRLESRFEKEEREFNLGHVKPEMPTRHLHRSVNVGLGH